MFCKAVGCEEHVIYKSDFCMEHSAIYRVLTANSEELNNEDKYPQYFKDFSDIEYADVYAVHNAFNLQDPSGALHHASKKILLSGVRTGGKSTKKDITEARDTLNRWLEINSTD